MFRQQIHLTASPVTIRVRAGVPLSAMAAGRRWTTAVAAPAPAPAPASAQGLNELRPALEALRRALQEIEQRRQQSLGELQHVAVELAIAAASHLVFRSIQQEEHDVKELVRQAVETIGLTSGDVIALHPLDLKLLRQRCAEELRDWEGKKIVLQEDNSVARGGCRVESAEGRMLVSDITSRLSDIRRHWMEELDDAQIERRRTAGDGQSLKRFPDRRETA